jgi:hypothetical protein
MALASSSAFSSFDQSAQVNKLDISPFLAEALILDFHLLGSIGMSTNESVSDIVYYWLEDALNSDTLTPTISVGTTDTSLTITASSAPHVGDYIYVLTKSVVDNTAEVMQVTTVNSTTNVSVSRGFNSTAASIATTSTLALVRNEQEFSDIGADSSVNPTVPLNYTSIITGRDLQISGSQLARAMSASAMADQVAHQLENRLIEWKRSFTRALLYSTRIGAGSDTVYHTFGGIRYWITAQSGQTETTAAALAMSHLNTANKKCVDQGDYPDLLVIGTDLVGSVNAIDATNRRMVESENKVGYMVNFLTLGQGNDVQVVVDGRVNAGDAFLLSKKRITPKPLQGRALFTLAGQDWVDGKKRRILGEWGLEFRQPQVHAYLSSKT